MDYQEEKIKPKGLGRGLITLIVVSSVLFVGACALGYFVWRDHQNYNKLLSDKQSLESRLAITKTMTTTPTATVDKEKVELKKEVASYKAGREKITAYNDFFKYMNQIVETHNGFSGWTDAEFQTGKSKAEATGDTDFVSKVDWAWYETSVDPLQRALGVWKSIADGIDRGLKQ